MADIINLSDKRKVSKPQVVKAEPLPDDNAVAADLVIDDILSKIHELVEESGVDTTANKIYDRDFYKLKLSVIDLVYHQFGVKK